MKLWYEHYFSEVELTCTIFWRKMPKRNECCFRKWTTKI